MAKFFKKLSQNKPRLALTALVILVFVLLPILSAQAQATSTSSIWDSIFGGVSNIVNYILMLPVKIIIFVISLGVFIVALLLGLVFFLIANLLNWLILVCMTVGITPGNAPPIIGQMWSFTRDFVDMIFILILVFIGLATILKIRDYEAKKLLPGLIIMALLVNFSGVIVGFIVDIGNIITNFFLGHVSMLNLSGVWSIAWNFLGTVWDQTFGNFGNFFQQIGGILGVMVYGTTLVVFYLFAMLIYFVLFIIFFLRIIILWILTILAPLAFGANILPATKKLFNTWLHQLIQWSMIGIPIGFFLYITSQIWAHPILPAPSSPDFSGIAGLSLSNEITTGMADLFSAILAPVAALAFLGIGMLISIQFAPSGAQGIINTAKKGSQTARKWAMRGTGKLAREHLVPESARRQLSQLTATNPRWGQGQGGFGGWSKRTAAWGVGYAARGTGSLISERVIGQAEEEDAKKAGEAAKKRDAAGNLGALRSAISSSEKRAILATMIDLKQISDARNENIVGAGNTLTDGETIGAYQNAIRRGKKDEAEKFEQSFLRNISDPTDHRLRDEFTRILDEETARTNTDPNDVTHNGISANDRDKGYSSYIEKIVGEAKSADDIKRLSKNWWANDEAIEAAHKFWGGNQIGEAARHFGRDFATRLQNTSHDAQWYIQNNNVAHLRYRASSGAASLGLSPVAGAETAETINKLIRPTPPPVGPTPPPEVPPSWVPGKGKNKWVPPQGYVGRTYTPAQEQQMVNELKTMAQQLNRLRKNPVNTTADEDAIKMLESAIGDIRQRLGK